MNEKILNDLVKVFNNNDCNTLAYNSNIEMKYIYLYAFNYYGNGDKDNVIDIENGADYTQMFMNSAYGFYFDEKAENTTLDILTTYYQEDISEFNFDKALLKISSVEQMVFQYKNKQFSANVNNSKIKDYWDGVDKDLQICIKYISNYTPKSKDEKEDIISRIQETIKPKLSQVSISLVFEDDLQEIVDDNSTAKEFVDNGYFELDKENNYLSFGDENSIIVNVKASSLKRNYEQYAKNGLFALNLRLYVKSPKVDSGLEESIKSANNNFWYYNNGIIVVCDDYKIKGNKLMLTNFSIINGGQTTRMIGETKFDNDFILSCKVIKNKYNDSRDKAEFVSKVAEASNTQKPIKATDIIANRTEQRLLKSQMLQHEVFVQIKRGETPNKELFSKPWQKIKNDELAQLICSGVYQMPGFARNSKKAIFEKEDKYKAIFGRIYNSDMLIDLIYLQVYFKKWAKEVKDYEIPSGIDDEDKDYYKAKKGLVKNGFYFITAMILLLAKLHYSKPLVHELSIKESDTMKFKNLYQSITFDHRIFNGDFKECKDKIYKLFEHVTNTYFIPSFTFYKQLYPDYSYSNFTKTDSNYLSIVKVILNEAVNGFNYSTKALFDKCFFVETKDDQKETANLVNIAINKVNSKEVVTTGNSEDTLDEVLKTSLTKLRSKIAVQNKLKNTQVFTDEELNKIATMKPKTTIDLGQCFNSDVEEKLNNYGMDILNIINK